jgi:hypothetical protein
MGKPPTKGQWKELLNKEIDKYWKNEWEAEKQRKSSLIYQCCKKQLMYFSQ